MQNDMATNQICKLQTNKNLIAFYDKLKPAQLKQYAQIHAIRDDVDGRKQSSLIGIEIQDYSAGTGDKNVKVKYNMSPEEIQFILSRVTAGFYDFEYGNSKIFGDPDGNGRCEVNRIAISRHAVDGNGNQMRNPWTFYIENGTGVKVKNSVGGYYMKKGSFKVGKSASIRMNDLELFTVLKRVDSYISVWETVTAFRMIAQGRAAYSEQAKQYAAQSQVNGAQAGYLQQQDYGTQQYNTQQYNQGQYNAQQYNQGQYNGQQYNQGQYNAQQYYQGQYGTQQYPAGQFGYNGGFYQ